MSRKIVSLALVLVLLLQGVAPGYAHATPEAPQQHCDCCPDEMPANLECADVCGAAAVVAAPAPAFTACRLAQQAVPLPAGDPGPSYLPLIPPPIS